MDKAVWNSDFPSDSLGMYCILIIVGWSEQPYVLCMTSGHIIRAEVHPIVVE